MNLPPVFVELQARIGDFQTKWGQARTEMRNLSDEGGSSMAKLGALTAGASAMMGVALAGAAGAAIHMADEFEQARARLEVAVANTGANFNALRGQVEKTDQQMTALGFTNVDTENSLATLTAATHSPAKAMADMGLAADIARGRQVDLSTATQLLAKVETGHVALLGRLGISTKDATGATISQEEAVKRLTDMYGGQAAAHAATFSGKLDVLKASSAALGEELGGVVLPVASRFIDEMSGSVRIVGQVSNYVTHLIGVHREHASAADKSAAAEKASADAMAQAATAAQEASDDYDKLQSAVLATINAKRSLASANRSEANAEQSLTNDRRALNTLLRQGAVDTKAVKSAQDSLRSSTEEVTRAQRSLADAQRNLQLVEQGASQLDLSEAQLRAEEATNALAHAQDNLTAVQGDTGASSLDLSDAQNAVADATQRLTDLEASGTATALQLSEAQNAVAHATQTLNDLMAKTGPTALDLSDAQHQVQQAAIDQARAQADLVAVQNQGKAGSDSLRTAQDQLTAAQQSVTDAIDRQRDAAAKLREASAGDPDFAAKVAAAQEKIATDTLAVADAKYAQVTASEGLQTALSKENDVLGTSNEQVARLTANLAALEVQYGLTQGALTGVISATAGAINPATGAPYGSTAPPPFTGGGGGAFSGHGASGSYVTVHHTGPLVGQGGMQQLADTIQTTILQKQRANVTTGFR